MSKLLAALKARFASPAEALRALGLDETLLDSALALDSKNRKGRTMCTARVAIRRLGYDASQLDDNQERNSEENVFDAAGLSEFLRSRGLGGNDIEEAVNLAAKHQEPAYKEAAGQADTDMGEGDEEEGAQGTGELMEWLRKKLSPKDFAEMRKLAGKALSDEPEGAADLPPDLPGGLRPSPGGKLTPPRSNPGKAMDSRSVAMRAALRIGVDNYGRQEVPNYRRGKNTLANDGLRFEPGSTVLTRPAKSRRTAAPATDASSRDLESFEKRNPGAARIGFSS